MQTLDELLVTEGIAVAHLDLVQRDFTDVLALEAEVRARVKGDCAIHLFGGEAWLDHARIESFNIRREAFAQIGPMKLLLWLTAAKIKELATAAPDLWAWRGSAIFQFQRTPHDAIVRKSTEMPYASRVMPTVDTRTLNQRGQRIVELRALLKEAAIPDEARGLLLDEWAGLHESLGQLDEALRIRVEDELPVYEKLGDVRSRLITEANLGQLYAQKGDIERARALWRHALADAQRLQLPEAGVIERWLAAGGTVAGSDGAP